MKYTKETLLGDLIKNDPEKASLLMEFGMHCVTCFAAAGETIEEACMVHGIDVDEILTLLNSEEKKAE